MRENSVKAEADAVPDAGNAYTAATSQSHGKTGIIATSCPSLTLYKSLLNPSIQGKVN